MVGVKFLKMEDKGRFETNPLEIGRSGKLKTVAEMIEFVTKYNTFFAVDTELPTDKIQQFKQGKNKEDYITQNDLKSDWTDCVILDLDRHDMVNPTNDNQDNGLRDLSLKFGHVLYAESKTGSAVFKGRLFMFMSKKILKAKARMLL